MNETEVKMVKLQFNGTQGYHEKFNKHKVGTVQAYPVDVARQLKRDFPHGMFGHREAFDTVDDDVNDVVKEQGPYENKMETAPLNKTVDQFEDAKVKRRGRH